MPEPQTPPADDSQGSPDPKVETAETPKSEKVFKQADVDRIVAERLARAVPADYEDAKAKAARLDAIEEQQKTDLQKAEDKAKAAEQERDAARAETLVTKRETAILVEAAKQGADADVILALLLNSTDITVADGKVIGVAEAVTKLLESKPHLKLGAPKQSGSEFGGINAKTTQDRIAELEKKGDKDSLAEARVLKMTSAMVGT